VTLEVSARDLDCAGTCTSGCGQTIRADLTSWAATGGSFLTEDDGVTGSPYTASAEWEAPTEEATYIVTVSLSDSGSFMCGGRSTVTAEVTILVTTSTNQPPIVDSVTASPARLFPGDTSGLTCAASDPEGDPLAYTWSADAGAVTPGEPGAASFVAGAPGTATLTCLVTDSGGATASGTTRVSVTDAVPEASLVEGLGTPQRVAVDSRGDVYVADRAGGGLTVVGLFSGELIYHLPLPGVGSVAVDWEDRLLVGGLSGARVVDRRGGLVLPLDPGSPLGDVSDVAVDLVNQRYAVLYRSAARVVVYDAVGTPIAAFGSNGDGPGELKRPLGLAVTPAGQLVVGDSGHGRIKIFDLDGTVALEFGDRGSGVGEFVQLDDVAVGTDGIIYASDPYQDWVQTFNPDGTPREVLGTYGDGPGQFMTPTGVAPADSFRRLVVASVNSSSLQVFRLGDDPVPQPSSSATLSSDSLSFVPQAVGTASDAQIVTLANSGTAPLGIRNIDVDGDFTQTSDCDLFVDPGQSCSFSLTFTPLTPGPQSGSMTVETSTGVEVLDLTGEAFIPAILEFSPESLAFADQPIGTVSDAEPVRVTNGGTVDLVVSAVRISEGFGVVDGCGGVLAGGAVCVLEVYFAPQEAADVIPGTLTIETSTSTRSVPLEGRGVLFDVSADPPTIDFGHELVESQSGPQTIRVTNSGGDFAEIGNATLEGARPEAFVIREDLCSGVRLEVGQACDLAVAFRPLEEGPHSARLRVPSNAGDSPDAVVLLGSAHVAGETTLLFADDFESGDLSAWSKVVPAVIQLARGRRGARAELDLGEVPVGSRSPAEVLVVINAGDRRLRLASARLAGSHPQDFQVWGTRCLRRPLARGGRCMFRIRFAPTAAGAATAELRLRSRSGALLGTVTLTGAGVSPEVEGP